MDLSGDQDRQAERLQVRYWLALTRNGSREEQARARTTMAARFEAHGMFEEAIDFLQGKIDDGGADPETYQWLAHLHLKQRHLGTRAEDLPRPRSSQRPLDADSGLDQMAPAIPTVRTGSTTTIWRPSRVAALSIAASIVLIGIIAAATLSGPASSFTGESRVGTASATTPSRASAIRIDPRRLVADPKEYIGQNAVFLGKALNVSQNDAGAFTSPSTWVQLMATVEERSTSESVVVEFRPRVTGLLKDECYRIYGIVAGTTRVRRTLTGAEDEVPLIAGYAWESSAAEKYGGCDASALPYETEAVIQSTAIAILNVTMTAGIARVETVIAAKPSPYVPPTPNVTPVPVQVATSLPTRGQGFIVRGTGANGLIVRRTPAGDRVASANEGEIVFDLGQSQQIGGREWRRVRAPDGVEGWAVAEFFAEQSGEISRPSGPSARSASPADQGYWTVILGSFGSRSEAETLAVRARTRDANATVLFSSDYASLVPGYWVTHVGRYSDRGAAEREAQRFRDVGFSDAFPREVRR